MKSKEEDELGIATPDLVLHDESTQLVIKGEGFMGQLYHIMLYTFP
jgi:hypothetical protein